MPPRAITLAFACLAACGSSRVRGPLATTAERSGFVTTGRYAETVELCHAFAGAFDNVFCDVIGETVEGRELVALRIERAAGAPYVYVQAGIHAGEIEGKDAGFWFVRDLLDGKVAPGALARVNVMFVPVLNPDGHERFGPNHRPNQRGPEEMGFRTNAARLNLNRDWMKADAPETRSALRVFAQLDPVVIVDLHCTDGAKFEHDISVTMAPYAPRADGLDEATRQLSTVVLARLAALGHLPVDFYPSFTDDENPHSGFAKGEPPPRFSTAYASARGRIGVLVEAHSWRTYKERVASTYHTLQAVLEDATTNAERWRELARAADREQLAGANVPLVWKNDGTSREIDFRGYAYEKRLSDLTGGTWLAYDESTPEVWRVPLFEGVEPAVTITAPGAGYIVDGGFAREVAAILERHAIRHEPIHGELAVDVVRAESVTYQATYEGRTRAAITGTWTTERRTLDRGALFVPIAQPRARLILHLLEPALPDSLVQWGLFNAVFERKEYAEPYVLEEVARTLFARDEDLAAEYAAFAGATPSPTTADKLDWIYQRHPSWDERTNLLPVYRVQRLPLGAKAQRSNPRQSPSAGQRDSIR